MQMGHRTPLSVVEEFGLLDAAFPGRLDLGLGRSGGRPAPSPEPAVTLEPRPEPARRREARRVDGLLLPPPFAYEKLGRRPRGVLHRELLQQPAATTPAYGDAVDTVLALLAGRYRAANGVPAHVVPGEGAGVQVWVLGSSGGESAHVAGSRGLPFAANYHVQPGNVLDAVTAYRSAFRPSDRTERPHVAVSVDAVVADTDDRARRLAEGYAAWVLSIRTAAGAIPYPSAAEAAAVAWTEADRALVADRVATQLVGSPSTVVAALETVQRVTGADELVVTTMTHDHDDRVRSYELLADAWGV
jgi:luciferase family oxidoreductase group 1